MSIDASIFQITPEMELVAFFMTKRDPFLVRSEVLLMILDLFIIPLLFSFPY